MVDEPFVVGFCHIESKNKESNIQYFGAALMNRRMIKLLWGWRRSEYWDGSTGGRGLRNLPLDQQAGAAQCTATTVLVLQYTMTQVDQQDRCCTVHSELQPRAVHTGTSKQVHNYCALKLISTLEVKQVQHSNTLHWCLLYFTQSWPGRCNLVECWRSCAGQRPVSIHCHRSSASSSWSSSSSP